METVGSRIKLLRKKFRLSQQALADGAGVHRGNISHYEKGDWSPNYETCEKIASFLNVNVDWLMDGESGLSSSIEEPKNDNYTLNGINSIEFGERLKELLKNLKITQKDIAESIGVSKTTINNYVQGHVPDTLILYQLASKCNVSMEWLLTGKDLCVKDSTCVELNITTDALISLNDEEKYFISLIRQLSDRERAKIEGMLELKVSEAEVPKNTVANSSVYKTGSGEEAVTRELA